MRRTARAFTLGATLLSAACAGHGISLRSTSHATDPSLLLSCARSVASERGLGDITQPVGALELQAKSSVEMPAPETDGTPSYDVLTVKLSPWRSGFRMLVGSTSYALRQLRTASVGTSVARSEWVGTQTSTRVALVRDAVLNQCGTIGN